MIGLIGYNFCSDGNSADPTPTGIDNITKTKLSNGIFDHFNMSRNVVFDYNSVEPIEWDIDTIINANFNGNIDGGNIEASVLNTTSVRIKRRVKGTFDWITIKEVPISKPEDLSFVITDNLATYDTEYEYAFVPLVGENEGNYIINSIMSKFQGVFICDAETVFKFSAGVEYSNNQANQEIGVFQPYNRQYPVIVSNSVLNYKSGSIGGWILPDNFDQNRVIDRKAITKEKEVLLNFLMNKKPKMIKDMNGNKWLVFFTGNPSLSYDNNYGQGMVKVNAEWTEIGDSESKDDLYEAGMIPTKR